MEIVILYEMRIGGCGMCRHRESWKRLGLSDLESLHLEEIRKVCTE